MNAGMELSDNSFDDMQTVENVRFHMPSVAREYLEVDLPDIKNLKQLMAFRDGLINLEKQRGLKCEHLPSSCEIRNGAKNGKPWRFKKCLMCDSIQWWDYEIDSWGPWKEKI